MSRQDNHLEVVSFHLVRGCTARSVCGGLQLDTTHLSNVRLSSSVQNSHADLLVCNQVGRMVSSKFSYLWWTCLELLALSSTATPSQAPLFPAGVVVEGYDSIQRDQGSVSIQMTKRDDRFRRRDPSVKVGYYTVGSEVGDASFETKRHGNRDTDLRPSHSLTTIGLTV